VLSTHLDFDGDTNIDLVMGDLNIDTVSVIYGTGSEFPSTVNTSTLSANERLVFTGADTSECGSSLASAGDFNRDGYDDLLVGCRLHENAHGAAVLLWGGPRPLPRADFNISSMTLSDGVIFYSNDTNVHNIGFTVPSAGDFNGDGSPLCQPLETRQWTSQVPGCPFQRH